MTFPKILIFGIVGVCAVSVASSFVYEDQVDKGGGISTPSALASSHVLPMSREEAFSMLVSMPIVSSPYNQGHSGDPKVLVSVDGGDISWTADLGGERFGKFTVSLEREAPDTTRIASTFVLEAADTLNESGIYKTAQVEEIRKFGERLLQHYLSAYLRGERIGKNEALLAVKAEFSDQEWAELEPSLKAIEQTVKRRQGAI